MSGILHKKRNIIHAIRKEPAPSSPPLEAAIRGNRQMLPVPTAMPRALTKNANRDENRGVESDIFFPFNFLRWPPNL